jgi:hypothetical protein
MASVIIGVAPHKLSATIGVVDEKEAALAKGRSDTDKAGYAAMRRRVAAWPERTWAVEGSNGAGRPLGQRLLADGERVVDVPAKLSARARVVDTGHNRKTDAHDAHAVAVVAVRTRSLRVLSYDDQLEALRMLVDRRQELTRTQPAAAAAVRAHAGEGEEGHHSVAGQGDSAVGAASGRGRQDPPTVGGRAACRPGGGGPEDQGSDQGAQGDGRRLRVEADGPARYRAGRGSSHVGRRR